MMELRFISGGIIIKRINLILIIIFSIFSCTGSREKITVRNDRPKTEIKIYKQHWNLTQDLMNLFIHVELPINRFVFTKALDHFYSNLVVTMTLIDMDHDTQIFRDSWNEKIIQTFYEDTRNVNNYFSMEKNIELTPGKYKLFINVQDGDSRKNWRINEELHLKKIDSLGPILPFVDTESGEKKIAMNIMNDMDTLWFRSQIIIHDDSLKEIDYSIKNKNKEVGSGRISLQSNSINDIYLLPIPFTSKTSGWHDIDITYKNNTSSISIYFAYSIGDYWTDDLNEIVGVMSYLFPQDFKNKKIKNVNEKDKWKLIDSYWKKIDPTPNTIDNELLIQINKRVEFVNDNYSILMSGWKTDRGKIHIIHGPPYNRESYKDEMGNSYQKWIYQNGKQFIFINRNISGDYSLYREFH
mgnify:CR=1 FL=1